MPCSDIRDEFDQEHMAQGGALLCRLIEAGNVHPTTEGLMRELSQWYLEHYNRDAMHARRYKEREAERRTGC